jgi:cation diffusion facilitator family transporter
MANAARTLTRIAQASIGVGLAVLALKTAAWAITGSIAFYSDALESTVNVVTAIAAYAAVRISNRPADDARPYGYHKAEYLSAVLVGTMIILAAANIAQAAWGGFHAPQPITNKGWGLALNGCATAMNLGWCVVLLKAGRTHRSPALTADGHHLAADVVSSLGVVAGVALAITTGWWWLDPALAVGVAIGIVLAGWNLLRENVNGLMDAAVPKATLATIHRIIRENATEAIEAHDIRTRQAGRATFVEFHLIVSGRMSVAKAHGICDAIEHALHTSIPHSRVTIHIEPEEKAKNSGLKLG